MGIALLTLTDLLSPLQSFASRWIQTRRAERDCVASLRHAAARPGRASRAGASAGTGAGIGPAPARPRPLRVVRTVDAQQPGFIAGRVVLSGRLADVCAELDRLAALEAAEMSRSTRMLH
jgi:hypothetical protein